MFKLANGYICVFNHHHYYLYLLMAKNERLNQITNHILEQLYQVQNTNNEHLMML